MHEKFYRNSSKKSTINTTYSIIFYISIFKQITSKFWLINRNFTY